MKSKNVGEELANDPEELLYFHEKTKYKIYLSVLQNKHKLNRDKLQKLVRPYQHKEDTRRVKVLRIPLADLLNRILSQIPSFSAIDFDSVLEQLLSMSKDSPAPHDSRSLKTLAPKPNDKGKSHETCSYCSKSGHNDRSCYYKHPEKWGDTFREKHCPCHSQAPVDRKTTTESS